MTSRGMKMKKPEKNFKDICTANPAVADAFADLGNWKPNFTRISRKTKVPISTLFDFYRRWGFELANTVKRNK